MQYKSNTFPEVKMKLLPHSLLPSLFALLCFAAMAWAEDGVPYLDESGVGQTADGVTVIEAGNVGEIDDLDGWYVVRGNLERNTTLTVSGEVHIILEDGSDLGVGGSSSNAGINVSAGKSLNIYAQSTGANMGKLTATGYYAGIGGGSGGNGGTITINGGAVTATGDGGVGIGYGYGIGYGGGNGTVTITGGTVAATGGSAGIDGGCDGSGGGGGTVTITGGTITATGGSAGIDGGCDGSGGTVTISGGTVTATGSTGISGGYGIGYGGGSGTVTISGGTVTATGNTGIGGKGISGTITISGGTVTATGGTGIYSNIRAGGTFTLDGNAVVLASSIGATSENRILKSGFLFIVNIGTGIIFKGTPIAEHFPESMAATWEFLGGKSGIAYTSGGSEGFLEIPSVSVIEHNLKNNVSYIGEDGELKTKNGVAVLDVGNIAAIDNLNGWYLICGNLKRSVTLRVSGEAHIILEDGSSLAVTGSNNNAGIDVSAGNSLSIYAQSVGNNMGKLTVTGGGDIYGGAGIGGGGGYAVGYYYYGGSGGTVTITGGMVTATGGSSNYNGGGGGAGIGGGGGYYYGGSGGGYYYGGSGGTVTITGGTVTATGGGGNGESSGGNNHDYGGGAGIGGGGGASRLGDGSGGSGGTVTITGGTVTAIGGGGNGNGAGIGGGYKGGSGTFTLDGNAAVFASSVSVTGENRILKSGILFIFDIGTGIIFKGTSIKEYFPESMTATWEFLGSKSGIVYSGDYEGFLEVPSVSVIERNLKNNVSYIGEDGELKIANGAIVLDAGNIATIDNLSGWFLVRGNSTRNATIMVSGEANIILEDGSSLVVTGSYNNAGIDVSAGNSLSIYAQSTGNNMGKLAVTGGGGSGGNGGAGIGGGYEGNGGTVTITGGTVTATGGSYGGAGIGDGNYGSNGGIFTLDGNAAVFASSVSATDENRMLKSGILFIFDIGTGIIFKGTSITEHFPESMTATWEFLGGKSGIAYSGDYEGFLEIPSVSVIDYDSKNEDNVPYISEEGELKTVNDVVVLDARNITEIDNLNGWYLVRGNLKRSTTLMVSGEAHIILEDGSSLAVMGSLSYGGIISNAGINVSAGNSLSIYAQSVGSNMGKLTATGGYGAGIGGYYSSGGTITINGGAVTATTSNSGAGIGGGSGGSGGTVTINGGTVTATGGSGGAGIGGGYSGSGSTVTITGGTVTAIGGGYYYGTLRGGAGIGGTVTIAGGTVTAIGGGYYDGAGIGGTFTLDGNAVVLASSIGATSENRILKNGILFIFNIGTGVIFKGTLVTEHFPAESMTATWEFLGGKSGIAYASGGNEGFLEVPNVSVIERNLINNVPYICEDGELRTKNGVVVLNAGNIAAIDNLSGWFLVRGNLTRNATLRVSGEAHIILEDGSSLAVTSSSGVGINVSEGNSNSLAIYAQSVGSNMGKLVTSIGNIDGTITIAGGMIATGGIGGSGSTVTITGGTVTATGGIGIGGTFTLDGNAIVFASSIGATGENRILKNGILFIFNIGTGTIFENTPVTEHFPAEGMTAVWKNQSGKSGIAYVNGNKAGFLEIPSVSVIERNLKNNVPYIGENGEPKIANGVTVLDAGNIAAIDNLSGWLLVRGILTRNATLRVSGEAYIILEDGSSLAVAGSSNSAGIDVSEGNSLSIYAQSTGNNMGKLTATGCDGAGIGGGYNGSSGTITINGGTVTATGGCYSAIILANYRGAGIGGYNGSSGTITINGGIVTATGGSGSAGIGGYTVTITGGTVTATGGSYGGAGIGSGWGDSDSITITGGTVTATGGGSNAGIGSGTFTLDGNAVVYASRVSDTEESRRTGGILFIGNTGKVYGSTELQKDLEIESDYTLTVSEKATLKIPSNTTLTNNGKVTPANGSTITINGMVNGENKIDGANTSPSVTTKTLTSITLNGTADLLANTNQEIEYAINQTNEAPASGWQTETIFTGLTEKTEYWIFARSKENMHFAAGQLSAGLKVSTKAIPAIADLEFNIPTSHIYTNTKQGIGNVTGTAGMGTITVLYDGSTIAPTNAGEYAVTVEIVEGAEFVAADGIVLGEYVITAKPITVTADAKTKVYGTADPALTYSVEPALLTGDNIIGELNRAEGSKVGTYAVNQGTLIASNNYNITFKNADFAITAKPVTITGITAASKEYDGNATATVTGTVTISEAISGDNVTATSGTAQFADKNAGTDKPVTFSGFSLSGTDADNYTLAAQPATVTANITPAPLTLTANDTIISIGDSEPKYTYILTGLMPGETPENAITTQPQFALNRPFSNTRIGEFTITPSDAKAANYTIKYANATLRVTSSLSPLLHQLATTHPLTPTRNGVTLTAKTSATISVYNLSGKLISRQNYNAGNHSISFNHLPKGVYIIQAQFRTGVARNAPLRLTIH